LATLLPFVEEALLALVVGMKSSSSSFDVAGPLPLQAPLLRFKDALSLLFLAQSLGMKMFSSLWLSFI
jgi:hypothetical protein